MEAQPIFKYIGGKSWMRETLRHHLGVVLQDATQKGKALTRYIEPFAGGLGSFLSISDMLHQHGIKEVIIGDVSSGIITLYDHCFTDLASFQKVYWSLEDGFDKTVPSNWKDGDKESQKLVLSKANDYFKTQRTAFNAQKSVNVFDVKYAALFLFLQKHAFNGVYRENGKGEYNTPFNWSGRSIDRSGVNKGLADWVAVMKGFPSVSFVQASYDVHHYDSHTLVYADPPYANEGGIENKYHKEHFDVSKQIALINTLSVGSFLYSNHAISYLETELIKNNASIYHISRVNKISSNKQNRSMKIKEILAIKL